MIQGYQRMRIETEDLSDQRGDINEGNPTGGMDNQERSLKYSKVCANPS